MDASRIVGPWHKDGPVIVRLSRIESGHEVLRVRKLDSDEAGAAHPSFGHNFATTGPKPLPPTRTNPPKSLFPMTSLVSIPQLPIANKVFAANVKRVYSA